MNRTKLSLAIIALTLAFTSCRKEYRCVCEWRPGVMQITNLAWPTVKADNWARAADKCDEKDSEKVDCWVE